MKRHKPKPGSKFPKTVSMAHIYPCIEYPYYFTKYMNSWTRRVKGFPTYRAYLLSCIDKQVREDFTTMVNESDDLP